MWQNCGTNPTAPANRYKNYRFPADIISHAVWLYFRFCLSFRDVEELLLKHGVIVTYEAIRKGCRKFGQHYANQLRRRRPQPGDKWHLDEVFLTIKGAHHYLWRAVDQAGTVLDILVQRRRDNVAAKKFFRKLLKGLTYVPRVIVTDKLKSYGAAKQEILPGVEHRQHGYLNNRAEVRLVGQKPNTPWCLGDWPWGPKRSGSRTPELESSVGVIPTVRGEGLNHMPHGSDWSSIREAGMNAAQREPTLTRLPGEIDRGTRRKGKQLSLG
jgi:transposase-like protein